MTALCPNVGNKFDLLQAVIQLVMTAGPTDSARPMCGTTTKSAINRTSLICPGKPHGMPKSPAADCRIPVDQSVVAALRAHRSQCFDGVGRRWV